MQDFTGVPAVVDLAAMRDAMADMGGDPAKINPLVAGRARDRPLGAGRRVRHARRLPRQRRARVRAQPGALRVPALGPGRVRRLRGRAAGHRHRPPGQPRVPRARRVRQRDRPAQAYPDTLVGTDSHTTMVNGLGVLGWGVGGIEAEAAMLGQPMSMLIPQVLGFRLHGELPEGATATDLVLTVTEMLRERGVVGQVRRVLRRRPRRPAARRPRDDRQHVARVRLDLRDLPDRRRDAALPASSPAARRSRSRSSRPTPRSRACGTTSTPRSRPSPTRSSSTSATVEPSLAGPKRPQDRVVAERRAGGLPRGAARLRAQRRRAGRRAGRGRRRVLPGLRPARQRRARARRAPRDARRRQLPQRRRRPTLPHNGTGVQRDASTARPSSSTTATS